MPIKPPFTDVQITKASSGFYEGYSAHVAIISKGIMIALVLWALVSPGNANAILGSVNSFLLQGFNAFYVIITGLFFIFLVVIAIIPQFGRRPMSKNNEPPEFSNFSWFAMMFGAGLGVGLMVFATAEPVLLWGGNPVTISGAAEPNTQSAVESAYRYTFLHYGFSAWAIYVVTGLSLAYYAYTRDMPLTIRSALTPLFGKLMNGIFGHIVDALGVIATILGVSVTIGFGVSQFIEGIFDITGMKWMMDDDTPGRAGLITGLVIIMGLSIISAVSGVERGIKYLSNLNLVLSFVLIMTFVIFGSFLFSITTYGTAVVDYILNIISLSFGAFGPQSAADFVAALPAEATQFADDLRAGAQNAWGTFYWAWWIAFSPFVGLFLARISRGRTVREFIIGCVFLPSLVCFAWMTILGGTAIDLELSGAAAGEIIAATNPAKLFVTLHHMISGPFLFIITVMCVVLILTFLVTSADSGILVMNTIMSGGQQHAGIKHRIIWGVILTFVIGALLIAGKTSASHNPMTALQNAMIIGALPFTIVMGLMCVALGKALYRDNQRDNS